MTEADSLSHLVVVGSSARGIEALSELVYSRHVEENLEEHRRIVNSLLIKGTKFFRDPDLFEYLGTEIQPEPIEEDVR